jgi:lipopolysaccharide export system permease protein
MMMSFPIAVLLGTMMVYSRMTSDREVIALYASGYTVKQLLVPAITIGLITTILLLWWGHRIAPKGSRVFQAAAIEVVQKTATAGIKPGIFTPLGGMVFSPTSVREGKMYGLKLFEQKEDGIAGIITAPTAQLSFIEDQNILLMHLQDGVLHQTPTPDRDVVILFDDFLVSIIIPNIVSQFATPGRFARTLSDSTLKYEIDDKKTAITKAPDEKIRKYYYKELKKREIELASRTAQPMACFIMAFLGAILGLRSRSAKRSACYSLTVAAVFIYYSLLSFGSNYAEDGVVSAWLGMWMPNFISIAVSGYLYWSMSDR